MVTIHLWCSTALELGRIPRGGTAKPRERWSLNHTCFSTYFLLHYRKVGYSMGIDVDNLTSPMNSSFSDCSTNINDTNYILREQVQSATSQWTLYISLAGIPPSLLACLFYGSMSDRMGRRMCFILPPIGSITRAIIQALAIYFELPVWVFLFINIEYLFGSTGLVTIGCLAYITDTTDQRHLAIRMIILDMLVLVAGVLSQLCLGYMIKALGYFWPMMFVIGGLFLTFNYAIFFIPETIANTENAKMFDVTDFTPALKLLVYDDGTGRSWKINILLSTVFLYGIFDSHLLLPLVKMNAPLCWNSVLMGYYSAVAMAITGIGAVLGAILKRCFAEEWIIVLAHLSVMLENAYIPFVKTTIMMFMAPVLGVFAEVSSSMKRAVLSSYVGQNEKGALFAGLSFIVNISSVGQILMNNIYSATILFLQGRIVFILTATVGLLCTFIVLFFILRTKDDRHKRIEREKQCVVVRNDNYGSIET